MGPRAAPALLPAAAVVAGAALGLLVPELAIPGLVALAGLALALGERGRLLVALTAGMLAARVGTVVPSRQDMRLDPARPVVAELATAGHGTRSLGGVSVPARVLRLRQGGTVATADRDIVLELPEDAPLPPLGSRLRAQGYLRRSAGFANEPPVEPGPPRLRVKVVDHVLESAPAGPFGRLSGGVRAAVERGFDRAGRRTSGIVLARALLLGDTSEIPAEQRRALRRSGLAHLLAVSGFNVTLLAGLALLAGCWLPRRARLGLALAAIGLYVLLVGPMPPILRAAIMGFLALMALLLERPPQALNALAVAAGGMVLVSPPLVTDLAFQLTVAATAGVVALAAPLAARWSALPAGVARPLAATVAAQVATLPWALPAFQQVSLASPLLNLVAIPWSALTLAAAVAWSGLSLLLPAVARCLVPVLDLLAAPWVWLAAPPPEPFGLLPLAVGRAGAVALTLVVGIALWWPRRWLLGAAGLLVLGRCATAAPTGLELRMLDVGQGDAVLLRDGRAAVLVDGGGWSSGDLGGRVLLPALAAAGVRRLDAVVLTHPDRDHCRGLADLVDYLPVDELWTAPGWTDDCAAELLGQPGLRLRPLWAGERAAAGRWRFAVLHPAAGERGADNDRSLVVRATAAGLRLLLTGDVAAAVERRLVRERGAELRCDLLKVAHHGSKGSSTAEFLAAARPRLALISAGRGNPYGHPAPAALERLAAAGAPVLRTDRDGEIVLRFDGPRRWRLDLPGAPR